MIKTKIKVRVLFFSLIALFPSLFSSELIIDERSIINKTEFFIERSKNESIDFDYLIKLNPEIFNPTNEVVNLKNIIKNEEDRKIEILIFNPNDNEKIITVEYTLLGIRDTFCNNSKIIDININQNGLKFFVSSFGKISPNCHYDIPDNNKFEVHKLNDIYNQEELKNDTIKILINVSFINNTQSYTLIVKQEQFKEINDVLEVLSFSLILIFITLFFCF